MEQSYPYNMDSAKAGEENAAAVEPILAAMLRAGADPELCDRMDRALLAALTNSADREMALSNFSRWLERLGYSLSLQRLLLEDESLMQRLLQVFAGSQYFADILCRDPAYYEFLVDAAGNNRGRTPAEMQAEVTRAIAPFRTYETRLDALRRAKRREMLRIGVRDLVGLAPYEEVVGGISAFADAAIAAAYQMAREEVERRADAPAGLEFAVIAMGKLGGQELNYSSDIDLMFVYRGESRHVDAAHRMGEKIIQALARPTAEGYVFRVDMRLRPEGRLGPLVRSLDSYRDYYDHCLEHWERQALLKARFVAGDAALGEAFHALIAPYVYRTDVALDLVEELRLNKLRLEKRVEVAGERYANVKDGYGGIRDVEFTVQLLQLAFGARHPILQTRNTLEALAALEKIGILDAAKHQELRDAYIFMRTVEHRLQIMDERAVRCLPKGTAALRGLALRMPRAWRRDPAVEFLAEYRRRAGAVRDFHRRLFFDPFRGAEVQFNGGAADAVSGVGELLLALDTEEARQRLRQYLVASGFTAPERALADLDRLAGVMPGRHEEDRPPHLGLLARVGPRLLETAAAAPDPDAALTLVAELAQQGEPGGLLAALGESAFARKVLCQLGGTAPAVVESVRREPALLDMLFEPEAVAAPADAPALRARLQARLAGLEDYEAQLNALRRFKRREILRIAAADVLTAPDVEEVARNLTLLAEVCVAAALDLSIAAARARGELEGDAALAVFGLGRVGSGEMLYSSDLDLVLVCALPEGDALLPRYRDYARLAKRFQDAMTRLLRDGDLYAIDLRLRPEGKGGDPAPSLDACRRYYAERAQTWERQAMLRARFLAGNAEVGKEFAAIITPFAYPADPSPALADEVRAMKRRVEKERTDPATRDRDLKLGPGGLSDVEFLVQLLQLCHGNARVALRQTNTMKALDAVEAEGLLPAAEAQALREGYRFQMCLRNLIYLRAGKRLSVLSMEDEEQRALARAMGLNNAGELLEAFYRHREKIRAIFETRFAPRS